MDDENAKEENHQPSSSKKESQRDSEKDLYDGKREYEERGKYDRHDDGVSVSESFTTGSDSVRSRIDTADVNPEIPKPPMGKGRREKPKRKKRGKRRNGRVEKRRSLGRRQVFRRAPKRRIRERKEIRDLSVSTIFTSSSRILSCKHCGHRCCRRRFQNKQKRRNIKPRGNKVKKIGKRKIASKKKPNLFTVSKSNQIGSRSMMLSPLFINTNSLLTSGELPEIQRAWCEISPQMIHEVVGKLTMWRQYVSTSSIADYMKRNYPVNTEEKEFLEELTEKLCIAAIAGILTQLSTQKEVLWCLNCALQNRELSESHVTRFWQAYGDTMSPVSRKITNATPNKGQEHEQD